MLRECHAVLAAGRSGIAIASLMAIGSAAGAEELAMTFNGYGTVGGSLTSNRDFTYHHDGSEFTGASTNFYVPLDTRIGAQAVLSYHSHWSITLQELVRLRGSNSFHPGTEWLYAQYTPNDSLKLRVGRVALDTFLFSESREVGYSLPWLEAPNDMYGANPFQVLDGGQVVWEHPFGHFNTTLQAGYGTSEVNLQTNSLSFNSVAHDVLNASVTVEYSNFLAKLSYTQLTIPTALPLSPTFTLNTGFHDKFLAAGLQYDNGKALIIGEWGRRQENSAPIVNAALSRGKSWYIAAGWRVLKFTPMLEFSNFSPRAGLVSPQGNHNSVSAMLRWDVVTNLALKVQATRAPVSDLFYWTDADFASNKRVNIYSVGTDFVF